MSRQRTAQICVSTAHSLAGNSLKQGAGSFWTLGLKEAQLHPKGQEPLLPTKPQSRMQVYTKPSGLQVWPLTYPHSSVFYRFFIKSSRDSTPGRRLRCVFGMFSGLGPEPINEIVQGSSELSNGFPASGSFAEFGLQDLGLFWFRVS